MILNRTGSSTIRFPTAPSILSFASVAGIREAQGSLGSCFDEVFPDAKLGKDTWEQGESQMQRIAMETALHKGHLRTEDIDLLLAGDLLNQCIASSFAAREVKIPMLGLYGACSTMAEGLALSAILVDGGYAGRTMAVTSSSFAAAERQYRFPLEYGGQRTPTAQWTVTGAGALIVGTHGEPPYVKSCTVGTVTDLEVTDANNMGAAMAPAFTDTLMKHLSDTGRTPGYYDLIVSGDLGSVGTSLALEMLGRAGIPELQRIDDCGMMIFNRNRQDVHAGGSGCGCSAVVLCGYLLNQMRRGIYRNILFCGTGALLSPVSTSQGQSIPAICHVVEITTEGSE